MTLMHHFHLTINDGDNESGYVGLSGKNF